MSAIVRRSVKRGRELEQKEGNLGITSMCLGSRNVLGYTRCVLIKKLLIFIDIFGNTKILRKYSSFQWFPLLEYVKHKHTNTILPPDSTYLNFRCYTVIARTTQSNRLIKPFVWQWCPKFRTIGTEYLSTRSKKAFLYLNILKQKI